MSDFIYTSAIRKIRNITSRKKVIAGGTSSSKTFGILAILIDKAARTPGCEISVVGETIPFLRRGAIKDFLKIMQMTGRFIEANWNMSLLTYRFTNKSYIEFFSAEQESKLRGARRNVLYVNEANNIDFESYYQLAIRTSDEIYLDFNPVEEFWAHTEVMAEDDATLITLTYKDNEALPPSIVKDIESAREKAKTSAYWANWWNVYGLGLTGKIQGTIFDNWEQCEAIPTDAELLGYGMDFGFSNDPTTLVGMWRHNGIIYLDELLYRTNMTNNDIGNFLKEINFDRSKEIICDSAEPKSIEELRRQGFNVKPAVKGPDSIRIGIDILRRYEMRVTKRSLNFIKELRGYQWESDNNGKLTSNAVGEDHCLDPVRYLALAKLNNRTPGKYRTISI